MDEQLEKRLRIYQKEGLARPEVATFVRRIIRWIETETGYTCTEEVGGPLVAHLLLALERIKTGKPLGEAWSEKVHQEANTIEKAVSIGSKICCWAEVELSVKVSREEVDFITLHVASFLLQNEV